MVEITTIANQLHKDHDYVMKLCEQKGVEIQADSQGMWLYDCDAETLLQQELEKPTRYNFRGMECTALQKIMITSDEGIQAFWLGNIIKYLYRRLNLSDLKKARQYLDFWIEFLEEKGDEHIK